MPHLVIIAGPNGAGKSTAAPALLNNALRLDNFVNADVIAQGLCAYNPEGVSIQAGRLMLNRIHSLAKANYDFAFETTLASKSFANWIPKLKRDGYQFHLIFLWLQSVELAISRVQERVESGGHFVHSDTIKRRYFGGIKNFFKLYAPIADSWQLYDNSDEQPILISSKTNMNKTDIINMSLWNKLLEIGT